MRKLLVLASVAGLTAISGGTATAAGGSHPCASQRAKDQAAHQTLKADTAQVRSGRLAVRGDGRQLRADRRAHNAAAVLADRAKLKADRAQLAPARATRRADRKQYRQDHRAMRQCIGAHRHT